MANAFASYCCTDPDGSIATRIDVLWITAGLACDDESIALTAATQPAIEDLTFGTFPWVPKITSHNPLRSCSAMQRWQARLDGRRRRLRQCRWNLHRLYHARIS